jgi:hypothetical protein
MSAPTPPDVFVVLEYEPETSAGPEYAVNRQGGVVDRRPVGGATNALWWDYEQHQVDTPESEAKPIDPAAAVSAIEQIHAILDGREWRGADDLEAIAYDPHPHREATADPRTRKGDHRMTTWATLRDQRLAELRNALAHPKPTPEPKRNCTHRRLSRSILGFVCPDCHRRTSQENPAESVAMVWWALDAQRRETERQIDRIGEALTLAGFVACTFPLHPEEPGETLTCGRYFKARGAGGLTLAGAPTCQECVLLAVTIDDPDASELAPGMEDQVAQWAFRHRATLERSGYWTRLVRLIPEITKRRTA